MENHISFEEHIPALTRFAISLTRNSDAANDLVQDTVMKVLTRDPDAEHVENVKSYLMSTLHNLFIDSTRRGKRMSNHMPIDDFDAASNDAPQNLILTAKEVVNVIEKMPSDVADVLMRHARDGQSYAEIADDLGVPVGTVMSRISRARDALKNELCPNKWNCDFADGLVTGGYNETGL